jgi:hypothetical protein
LSGLCDDFGVGSLLHDPKTISALSGFPIAKSQFALVLLRCKTGIWFAQRDRLALRRLNPSSWEYSAAFANRLDTGTKADCPQLLTEPVSYEVTDAKAEEPARKSMPARQESSSKRKGSRCWRPQGSSHVCPISCATGRSFLHKTNLILTERDLNRFTSPKKGAAREQHSRRDVGHR